MTKDWNHGLMMRRSWRKTNLTKASEENSQTHDNKGLWVIQVLPHLATC
jgi:hypothetical protein